MENLKSAIFQAVEEVVKDLMDSSSSSEDETVAALVDRDFHPRVQNFVEEVVKAYSDSEFKKNFRLSRESAEYILARYATSKWYRERTYKGGRQQSTAETYIFSFLWFCANKTKLREVGNLFNMTSSSTHSTLKKVVNFIVEDLAPEKIKFPQADEGKESIAKQFEEIAGFPNVLGCIDGSYIASRKPKHKIRSTYTNRHDCVSITMQGICDAKLRFLDVFTGVPSKIHESRVLKLSFIGKHIASLCSPKYYLLGDAAYPLREYLLTPFRDYGNLSEADRIYNNKFCQTRVKIENAFGLLKCRFRQLMRLDFHNVEFMAKFIIACCTLHNICIDMNDICDVDADYENVRYEETETVLVEQNERRDELLSQLGTIKRNEVKNLF